MRARNAADALAIGAGLIPLGERWVELDLPAARKHLMHVLTQGLAYGASRMRRSRAEELTDLIMSTGTSRARAFFNGWDTDAGWNPATNHTFDSGLAYVTDDLASILWVADED